jgi:hypothetical protein
MKVTSAADVQRDYYILSMSLPMGRVANEKKKDERPHLHLCVLSRDAIILLSWLPQSEMMNEREGDHYCSLPLIEKVHLIYLGFVRRADRNFVFFQTFLLTAA